MYKNLMKIAFQGSKSAETNPGQLSGAIKMNPKTRNSLTLKNCLLVGQSNNKAKVNIIIFNIFAFSLLGRTSFCSGAQLLPLYLGVKLSNAETC